MSTEAWNIIPPACFKISKNGISNSYFVKIKTSRMQTSKLLGNKKKAYILDVICNRICFGEVQEEVLNQCIGQVSQHPEQKAYVSISGLFQKKQAGCLRKCFCKYSTEVSRFALEILEESYVIISKLYLL